MTEEEQTAGMTTDISRHTERIRRECSLALREATAGEAAELLGVLADETKITAQWISEIAGRQAKRQPIAASRRRETYSGEALAANVLAAIRQNGVISRSDLLRKLRMNSEQLGVTLAQLQGNSEVRAIVRPSGRPGRQGRSCTYYVAADERSCSNV